MAILTPPSSQPTIPYSPHPTPSTIVRVQQRPLVDVDALLVLLLLLLLPPSLKSISAPGIVTDERHEPILVTLVIGRFSLSEGFPPIVDQLLVKGGKVKECVSDMSLKLPKHFRGGS